VTRSEQEKVRGMEWVATGGTLFKGAWWGGRGGWGGAGNMRRHAVMRWGGVPDPIRRRRATGNGPAVALTGGRLTAPRGQHKTGEVGSLTCGPGGHSNRRWWRI
jgi:hypothetical protein